MHSKNQILNAKKVLDPTVEMCYECTKQKTPIERTRTNLASIKETILTLKEVFFENDYALALRLVDELIFSVSSEAATQNLFINTHIDKMIKLIEQFQKTQKLVSNTLSTLN